jgi:sialate O-acetylesterase
VVPVANGIELDEASPGKFFLAMISPLAPFAISGFLWYQGETNCFQNESSEYAYKLEALIKGWRKVWNGPNLPFYYVQIAPFYYSKSAGQYPLTKETLPRFWEAQTSVLRVPYTGMIGTTDLVTSPEDLHPGFKWEIGRRLAKLALAKHYHLKLVPSGPVFRKKNIVGNKIELDFDYTGSGLISKDDRPLSQFMIAGADGNFVEAQAAIEGNKVVVWSNQVLQPVDVRFGWDEGGRANLFNKEGLPALPFRTDHAAVVNRNELKTSPAE